MTTPKRATRPYTGVTVVNEGDPRGPGGIPLEPLKQGDRLSMIVPDPTIAEPPPVVTNYSFEDTGEQVSRLEDCPDGVHSWWKSGKQEWQADRMPKDMPKSGRIRRERDQRVIVMAVEQTGTREFYFVAAPTDREAHLAAVARHRHLAAHPEEGEYLYVRAGIAAGWPHDVNELLSEWQTRHIRPVVLGQHVSPRQAAGGTWAAQVTDRDDELARAFGPLLLAKLGGPALSCEVTDCTTAAAVLVVGGGFICHAHAEGTIGQEPKPVPKRAGIAAAIASAIGA